MTTQDIVGTLIGDCAPVERIKSPARATIFYSAFAIAFAATVLVVLGSREMSTVQLPWFWIGEVAILVALLVCSIRSAVLLRIPGQERLGPWRQVLGLLAAWIAYLIAGTLFSLSTHSGPPVWPIDGLACGVEVMLLCAFPTGVMLAAVNRGYPTARRWAAFSVLVAGCTASVLGVEFHCVYESTTHHLLYHVVPVIGTAVLGLPIAKLFRA